jgi:hypothetical protein
MRLLAVVRNILIVLFIEGFATEHTHALFLVPFPWPVWNWRPALRTVIRGGAKVVAARLAETGVKTPVTHPLTQLNPRQERKQKQ